MLWKSDLRLPGASPPGKAPAPQPLGWWEALTRLFPSLWTPSKSGKEGVRAEWSLPKFQWPRERLGLEFPPKGGSNNRGLRCVTGQNILFEEEDLMVVY